MNFSVILRDLPINGVIAIEAATGTGKTTGIYRELQNHYEPTIFVMHTRVSINTLLSRERDHPRHVLLCTPIVALDHIINDRCDRIRTIVIDEAHVLSREYDTLFSLLQIRRRNHRFRVIMLSATLDTDRIIRVFPDVRILSLSQPSLFPIQKEYVPYENQPDHPIYTLVNHTTSLIQRLNPTNERVLVFMPGHEHCERILRYIQSMYNVVCLHGGMTDEAIAKTRDIMSDPSIPVICCTTNMSETAVTFPGISVVIDSGLRSTVRNGNQLVQEWCDRSSMIQRAGRTGRTCPGTVYRLMTPDHFESIPLHKPSDHNYDPIVLYLLSKKKIDPVEVLGEKAMPTMNKIRDMDITPDMYGFLSRCGLEIEQGVLLYRFMNQNAQYPDSLIALMVLCLSIISMYQTKPMSWVYIGSDISPKQKRRIWSTIREQFCVTNDLLASVVSIVLWVFSQKDPKKSAGELSFNFRNLRETRILYERVMKTCMPSIRSPCDLLYPGLWDDWGWKIQRFLYNNQPDSNIQFVLDVMNEPSQINDLEYGIYIGRGLTDMTIRFLSFEYIPSDMKRKHQAVHLVLNNNRDIVLWTMPPDDYRNIPQKLITSIMSVRRSFQQKEEWKSEFRSVVDEIRNEVAFRPNMCGMQDAMSDFVSRL